MKLSRRGLLKGLLGLPIVAVLGYRPSTTRRVVEYTFYWDDDNNQAVGVRA